MISSNDFRPGVTIEYNGDPCQVLEFQHVKPGKGAAFVRTKLKNLKTGATTELTFRGGEKLPKATIDRARTAPGRRQIPEGKHGLPDQQLQWDHPWR